MRRFQLDRTYMKNCLITPGKGVCLLGRNHEYLDFHYYPEALTEPAFYLLASSGERSCNTYYESISHELNQHPYCKVFKAAIKQHRLWPAAVLALLNCRLLINRHPWLRKLGQ